jgi:hypothetical protein
LTDETAQWDRVSEITVAPYPHPLSLVRDTDARFACVTLRVRQDGTPLATPPTTNYRLQKGSDMERDNVKPGGDGWRHPRDIAVAAETCFQESPYRTLRHVSCRADGDVLVLEGCLNTFFEKQLAQVMAAKISGVARVVNEIEVIGFYGHDDD